MRAPSSRKNSVASWFHCVQSIFNKDESTMDQVQHIQRANNVTRGGLEAIREMMSWPPSWKYDVTSDIRLRQSLHTHSRNSPAGFHPDPIWNDRALGFFASSRPNKNKNNKMSSDMGSGTWSKKRSRKHLANNKILQKYFQTIK